MAASIESDPLFANQQFVHVMQVLFEQDNMVSLHDYKQLYRLLHSSSLSLVYCECIALQLLLELSNSNQKLTEIVQELRLLDSTAVQTQITKMRPRSLSLQPRHVQLFRSLAFRSIFLTTNSFLFEILLSQFTVFKFQTTDLLQQINQNVSHSSELTRSLLQLACHFSPCYLKQSKKYMIQQDGSFKNEPFEAVFAQKTENGQITVQQTEQKLLGANAVERKIFGFLGLLCVIRLQQLPVVGQIVGILEFARNNLLNSLQTREIIGAALVQALSNSCLLNKDLVQNTFLVAQKLLMDLQTQPIGIKIINILKQAFVEGEMYNVTAAKKNKALIVLDEYDYFATEIKAQIESCPDPQGLNYYLIPVVTDKNFVNTMTEIFKQQVFGDEVTAPIPEKKEENSESAEPQKPTSDNKIIIIGAYSTFSNTLKVLEDLEITPNFQFIAQNYNGANQLMQSFAAYNSQQFPVISGNPKDIITLSIIQKIQQQCEPGQYIQNPFLQTINFLNIIKTTQIKQLFQLTMNVAGSKIQVNPLNKIQCWPNCKTSVTAIVNGTQQLADQVITELSVTMVDDRVQVGFSNVMFQCQSYLINFEKRIPVIVDGTEYKDVLTLRMACDSHQISTIDGDILI
ncbi:Hypothetical_protein [Hexamita inflata]|uniref:Hypothetical_protein n=1 Tax=Hexamita inflata TaxID=28002 RepID=A0AA86U9H1_9EUKA|nr:Hypothetical protein HINF_LOCUS36375 [Hexamita inflata]